ncbi:MAG: type 4a pilus biogenesis protein PilO [Gammaproteobacteria bacterium]|nr:type 4a pilus biogenesis protein PilO [Gammaproteobacteria bacterium]
MDLSAINFRDIDPNDIGSWPLSLKVLVIVVVCVGVLSAGYFFDTQKQLTELENIEKKEIELKNTFTFKQNKAVNLPLYVKQMEEMERSFGAMLRQLPSKTEVAELLVDISQTGLANGLEFQLFKPKDEIPAEFYAELPIKIRVLGSYHEFGNFISDVAALPRIVTLQEIAIRPAKGEKKSVEKLVMEATAKTFRYLDESDDEDS